MEITRIETWMRRCEALAQEARERGEAGVGSVIVQDDNLIAEAYEQVIAHQDIVAHAELLAIRQACQTLGTMDLTGCTLFTNIEPCWMCAFAIRETKISQVVIGTPVPDIGGATSRYPILTDPSIPGWPPPPIIIWYPPA